MLLLLLTPTTSCKALLAAYMLDVSAVDQQHLCCGAHFAQLRMCMCPVAGFKGEKELETLNAFLGAVGWKSNIAD